MIEESKAPTPNVARIYDFLLGGRDNYEADRHAARNLLEAVPDAAVAAWDNRVFLRRVVQFLARDAGVRQFIDIGTGLPTRGNVHSIAHRVSADSRVAYVDNDPVVITHARALLGKHANVTVIEADLRQPTKILAEPAVRSLIRLDEPVAILLVAVLHFISESERPREIVEHLTSAVAPGSYLVVSHVTGDYVSAASADTARELYEKANAPGVTRSRRQIAEFFRGLQMLPPGLVDVAHWRPEFPEPGSSRTIFYGGVGFKTGAEASPNGP